MLPHQGRRGATWSGSLQAFMRQLDKIIVVIQAKGYVLGIEVQ